MSTINAWNAGIIRINDKAKLPLLPITEPPCRACACWRPHVTFNGTGSSDGIRCCVADMMYSDFSCFKQDEAKPVFDALEKIASQLAEASKP